MTELFFLGRYEAICLYASQLWFPKLAAFNLCWSADSGTLSNISTCVSNPDAGDKNAQVKNGGH
ncbi:hypothetical protein QA447_11145 [Pseudomonas sp. abacavir_1]